MSPGAGSPGIPRRRRPASAALRCGPAGASTPAPVLSMAIEAATETASVSPKAAGDHTMATVGTLTRSKDGIFQGSIKTLSLNTEIRFVPSPATDREKGPRSPGLCGRQRHRFRRGLDQAPRTERAPTTRSSSTTPTPTPIYASLVEATEPGTYNLVWSRRPDRGRPAKRRGASFSTARRRLRARATRCTRVRIRWPMPDGEDRS